MRRIITVLTLVALLVGAASALAKPAGTRQSNTGNVQASYMFVFNGPSSTMAPVAGQAGVYTFTMPLTSSAQPVIWFTVRPSRMTGTFPMSQFVGLWALKTAFGFAADPPNVAITTTSMGSTNVFVAEMSGATVQASGLSNTLVLQATMTALQNQSLAAVQGSKTSFLGQSAKTTSATPVATAKQTTVFVERSVCASGNCVPVPIS